MRDDVMVAVDPHKASNTAAVPDPVTKTLVESARCANDADGYIQLTAFACRRDIAGGRSRAVMARAGRWRRGWSPTASRHWTSPPSWPPGCGCQGAGSEAVGLLARYLFEQRGHHRITIDPAAGNERAIRSYTKAGLRPVGVMRQYERGDNGRFHDGLLMDLLRGELAEDRQLQLQAGYS